MQENMHRYMYINHTIVLSLGLKLALDKKKNYVTMF